MRFERTARAVACGVGMLLTGSAAAELTPELLAALRGGGYILYMRHGPTDSTERAKERENLRSGRFRLDDCATQRNLTPEGREKVRAAGRAFRGFEIPVGVVLASRYCRTLETARLFHSEPVAADDLTPDPVGGEPGRAAALGARLMEAPAPGTNVLIVAHGGMMKALQGTQPNQGEMLVYRYANVPDQERPAGRVKLDEWVALAGKSP